MGRFFGKAWAAFAWWLLLLGFWGCGVASLVFFAMWQPLIGWVVFPFIILMAARHKHGGGSRGGGWTHGTARLASPRELARNGLLAPSGLILGRLHGKFGGPTFFDALPSFFDKASSSAAAVRAVLGLYRKEPGGRHRAGRMIRLRDYVHLSTFAPTGAGKSVSVLVPNLLTLRNSCVVIDPKGELYRLTGQQRQAMGQTVAVLDPFSITGGHSSDFNPLDFIDARAVDFLDACRDLANSLVMRAGTEHEPHWNDSAELIITAFIAFVCGCEADPTRRNLATVKALLSTPQKFCDSVAAMNRESERFGGVVARLGGMISWYKDKELNSVLTTVQRHLAFLDSPTIAGHVSASGFDPMTLRKRATLYLCLPADRLETLAPLQRMWVSTILRVLSRNGGDDRNPVLFLLDEVGNLGKIQALETATTLLRGAGIRLWFFWQSVDQMKKCYGDRAETVLDNMGTLQFFGIRSFETADYISKRIGETTIRLVSTNSSYSSSRNIGGQEGSPSGSVSRTTGYTRSESGRRLIKPEEVLTRPADTGLIFHRNLSVIQARLVRYFDDPELGGDAAAGREESNRLSFRESCGVFCLVAMGVFFALWGAVLAVPGSVKGGIEAVREMAADASTWAEHARDWAEDWQWSALPYPGGGNKAEMTPEEILAWQEEEFAAIEQSLQVRYDQGKRLKAMGFTPPPECDHETIKKEINARVRRVVEQADRKIAAYLRRHPEAALPATDSVASQERR